MDPSAASRGRVSARLVIGTEDGWICRHVRWSELLHQIGMGGEFLHAVEIGISLQERCLNEMVAVVLNRRNFLIDVPDSLGVGRVERVGSFSGNVSLSQFNRYESSSEMLVFIRNHRKIVSPQGESLGLRVGVCGGFEERDCRRKRVIFRSVRIAPFGVRMIGLRMTVERSSPAVSGQRLPGSLWSL